MDWGATRRIECRKLCPETDKTFQISQFKVVAWLHGLVIVYRVSVDESPGYRSDLSRVVILLWGYAEIQSYPSFWREVNLTICTASFVDCDVVQKYQTKNIRLRIDLCRIRWRGHHS